MDGVVYVHTQRSESATYEVHLAGTRSTALEFLRRRAVEQEQYYVIVETPDGNFGKDMIMIFDEQTQDPIELGTRVPLPSPQRSSTHCARCGYPVIAAKMPDQPSGAGSCEAFVSLEELAAVGGGYRCRSCGSLACAVCYQSVPDLPRAPDGELRLTCWVCQNPVELFAS